MPCTRKRTSPRPRASSSNRRMNCSPMMRRFCSGSVTPASAARNRSAASTWTQRHLEVVVERLDHLLGLVLAQQAVVDEHARELVADGAVDEQGRHRRVDAAGEGADDLVVDPTCSRIRSTCSSMNCSAVHVGGAWQASSTKWRSMSVPRGVWATSGWNWTAKRPRSRSSIAATGVVSVVAVHARTRPAAARRCRGGSSTPSGRPAGRRRGGCSPPSRTGVLPNSPTPVLATSPPSAAAIACMP